MTEGDFDNSQVDDESEGEQEPADNQQEMETAMIAQQASPDPPVPEISRGTYCDYRNDPHLQQIVKEMVEEQIKGRSNGKGGNGIVHNSSCGGEPTPPLPIVGSPCQ